MMTAMVAALRCASGDVAFVVLVVMVGVGVSNCWRTSVGVGQPYGVRIILMNICVR